MTKFLGIDLHSNQLTGHLIDEKGGEMFRMPRKQEYRRYHEEKNHRAEMKKYDEFLRAHVIQASRVA